MLSEGLADKAFLSKLTEARKLPRFDFPWPIDREEAAASEDAKKLYGRDQFVGMLKALDGYLTIRPELQTQLKGVLIVTDARDGPEASFRHVCNQIRRVGRFGTPTKPLEATPGSDGRPAVGVMLIPRAGRGSLETICLREMKAKLPKVAEAMEVYVRTKPIRVLKWSAEKRDKARLQCLIAATNESDPTVTLQRAFSGRSGRAPIIDVKASCFRNVYRDIKAFCATVGVV